MRPLTPTSIKKSTRIYCPNRHALSYIISDFTDGQDIIGLLEGLTFNDLTISQVGNDTQITATGLVITLQNVNSGAIDSNDFATISLF